MSDILDSPNAYMVCYTPKNSAKLQNLCVVFTESEVNDFVHQHKMNNPELGTYIVFPMYADYKAGWIYQ